MSQQFKAAQYLVKVNPKRYVWKDSDCKTYRMLVDWNHPPYVRRHYVYTFSLVVK